MNSTPLHTGTTTSTDQPGSLAPHSNDRRPHPPSHFPPAKPQDAPPQKTRHPAPNPRTRPETAIPGDDRTKLARMGESRDERRRERHRAVIASRRVSDPHWIASPAARNDGRLWHVQRFPA